MATSRFEFVGFRKNGTKGTEVIDAINLSVAQSQAKKKLKTITQTKVIHVSADENTGDQKSAVSQA
jgi:hypothetical protein